MANSLVNVVRAEYEHQSLDALGTGVVGVALGLDVGNNVVGAALGSALRVRDGVAVVRSALGAAAGATVVGAASDKMK